MMLREVRTAYDVVILDTPPVLAVVDTLEVVENTEAIVICAREAKLTRDQAKAGRRALERAPDQLRCLVITGLARSSEDYGYYASYHAYASES
jgi:Mrp family chromosome partitioning ATPase